MKTFGKTLLCLLLENQVRRLRKRYAFTVVAVAGSMGKTSSKLAIAQTLSHAGLKVCYQEGNYNDRLTVPLVFFNQTLPNLFDVTKWLSILMQNEKKLRSRYSYDVVVVELGTDGPGQMKKFAYLKPDIAVLTAIAPEHMEYFKSLDAVAAEELAVAEYSARLLVNADDVPARYLKGLNYEHYGLMQEHHGYYAIAKHEDLSGQTLALYLNTKRLLEQKVAFLGPQGRKIILAAAATAHILRADEHILAESLAKLSPFAGRMQVLAGIKDSTLIDDTYNATPAAVEAALTVLQSAKSKQRIAILGSMNELGGFSAEAHRAVGLSIDSKKVKLVVTIGRDAEDYLAPAAMEKGCEVASFLNPRDAGEYVVSVVKKGTVVLVKGSQNGVFSEEAIKPLLAHKTDEQKLVRQSKHWMKRKAKTLSL